MRFSNNRIMLLWVKKRILSFLDLRGKGDKSSTVTTRHVTASQNWFENKPKTILWHSEAKKNKSVKRVIQNFWQKRKTNIFFISKIFHMTSTLCLVKPSLWTSASSYFDSVCSRQCRRHLDTHSLLILIIMINNKWFLGDLIQVVFHRALASSVGVKDGTLTWRTVPMVYPKSVLGNNL